MSKKTLLKSIIAVSAATTMLFSTAFAAEITSTRTLYVKGSTNTVEVATTVTGLTAGDEVTYLAGDTTNPVYINQYTAKPDGNGSETYKYKTTRVADLAKTTVKMAKTNSSFGEGQTFATEATIPDPEKYTFNVTVDGVVQNPISVNPNEVVADSTVAFTLTLASGKVVDTVTVNGNPISSDNYNVADGSITIKHGVVVTVNEETNDFADANGNKESNIVITVKNAVATVVKTPEYTKGFKAPNYSYTFGEGDTAETVEGPMYAIYADSSSVPEGAEFGIVVANTKEELLNSNLDIEDRELYPFASTDRGAFAIAIIETGKDAEGNSVEIPDEVYATTYYNLKNEDGNSLNFAMSSNIIKIAIPKAN